jgi:peptidyl-prolyl cis-trans isomerase SurA
MEAMRFVILPLCLMGAFVVGLQAAEVEVKVIDEIVAKINGDIITKTEIERSRKQAEADLRQRGVTGKALEDAMKLREKDLLRDRIDQLLLVQRANLLNINVDADVSKYLAEIRLKNKIADPDAFEKFVREQTGMPFEDFRAETKNGILTRRVIQQEVQSRITVPRSEALQYYEAHKDEFIREEMVFLQEIMLSTEGKVAEEVEKKAKELVDRARKGEKFHELARDNSDAPSAQQGGDLGGWRRGQLDAKIEAMVWDKERNHVTDPIPLEGRGFLILKVQEHYQKGLAPFERVESEIMEKLYMPRFEPKVREFLTRLREEAFLELKEGYIDSSAAPGKNTAWQDPAELKPETTTKEEVQAVQRRKRMFWLLPIPGTSTQKPSISSSPR